MKKTFRTFHVLIFLILIPLLLNAQWVQTNGITNKTVNTLLFYNNTLFAGTEPGIYLSTNNGNSWIQTSLTNRSIYCFTVSGNNIFAGTDLGIYKSTNNGMNWNICYYNTSVSSLTSTQNYLFGAIITEGVCLSTDNGVTWASIGLSSNSVYSVIADSNTIYAGTFVDGIFKSQNLGLNWMSSGLYGKWIGSFYKFGNDLYVGTRSNSPGLFKSTNNGNNWIQTSLNGESGVNTIVSSSAYLFTGISNGIFMSVNNGINWINRNQGFNIAPAVYSLVVANTFIFAGTQNQGVWRREISEITETKNYNSIVPENFSLYQNYPNPFNPVTNIKYQIANNKFVSLKVFDVLGKEIETLVNEKQSAGTYEVNWNASQYPSGVYFYRLDANGFTDTKKMILLK